jgi:hypothetical protein
MQTKRLFGGPYSSNIIHFGRSSDNDREKGVIKGRITLTSEEIQYTFDDVVTKIIDSCLKLLRGYQVQVCHCWIMDVGLMTICSLYYLLEGLANLLCYKRG